ncbi:MAG TPA: SBBP repeat-containing protein [Bacteroidia bacterium]
MKVRSLFIFISFSLCAQANTSLSFIENKGQVRDTEGKTRSDILFYTDLGGKRIYFMRDMISAVTAEKKKPGEKNILFTRMDAGLEGTNPVCAPVGDDEHSSYNNYYLPNGSIMQVREFSRIVYHDLFPGTDLIFYDNGDHRLSYDYFSGGKKLQAREILKEENLLSSCLPWSTYYGGSGNDEGWGITADANNNSYTTGYTYSIDFPVSAGSFQDTVCGNYDAFVIKMDSCGNRQWTTFLGSSGNDFGQKICMNGNRIVAGGYTSGTDFPVSNNAWQLNNNGSYDAFLFELNSAGARVWATYFGGSGGELGLSVCTDMNKNIFLGGSTSSTDMPVQNAFQNSSGGPLDAFIAKFDSNGTRRWSTYFGGSSSEDVHSMTADNSGDLVAAGGTFSNDMPVSTGAFQMSNNGVQDGYLLKLDSTGSRIFSTYFGGTGNEDAYGICTDAQKNIYICGYTNSSDMPVTNGAYQSTANTGDEIYIAAFTPAGAQLWCTYFGGSGMDDVYAMSTDHNGHFYVLASTQSNDIPIIGTPVQASIAGMYDAFILKISSSGQPLWSTYFGGNSDEGAYDIFSGPAMRLFITGYTNSFNFPVTFGSYQQNNNGPEDAFITSLDGSFDITVGTNQQHDNSDVSVYPNPAAEGLFIHMPGISTGEISITVMDISGREVKQSEVHANGGPVLSYSVTDLVPGLYTLYIRVKNTVYTKKLAICR